MKRIPFRLALVGSILLAVVPASVFADARTPLGGLSLEEYCIANGHTGVTLLKPLLGPNSAYDNWHCATADGGVAPLSMEQACKWQYHVNDVQTRATNPDNAYTWVCYSAQPQK